MIRITSVLLVSALLGTGCTLVSLGSEAPAVAAPPPKLDGACEALRSHFPMPFHADLLTGHTGGKGEDQGDTVERIRRINAAFQGACP